jgi:hypothetical protein
MHHVRRLAAATRTTTSPARRLFKLFVLDFGFDLGCMVLVGGLAGVVSQLLRTISRFPKS